MKEPGSYSPAPINLDEFSFFTDPIEKATSQVGQPDPPDSREAPLTPVPGGTISGSSDCSNPTVKRSGTYYATAADGVTPTGAPIQVTGCVSFGTPGDPFSNFVFVGGLHLPSTQSVVKVQPGRYIVAGAQRNTDAFYMHNGASLIDQTPLINGNAGPNSDMGEIFVFTDTKYPGLEWLPQSIKDLGLGYGRVEVQTGSNDNSEIILHGLNGRDPVLKAALPDDLQNFTPIVFYVDQGNSRIDYDNGVIQKPGDPGCTQEPCLSDTEEIADPMMMIQSSPNFDVYGTVYLPRGASLEFQGSGTIDSPTQFIFGTMRLGGGAQLNPTPLSPGFTYMTTVLVE